MANSNKKIEKLMQMHDVLKTIYFVVAGLSIVKALEVVHKTFTSSTLLEINSKPITVLLFITFLVTIVRFCQGVSRVLADQRTYAIFDFYGFFIQGICFFFMAVNIVNVNIFIIYFLVMLFVDSMWLISISYKDAFKYTKVERQWLHSNFIILAVVTPILYLSFRYHLNNNILLTSVVTLISVVAAYFDHVRNNTYYNGDDAGEKTELINKPYVTSIVHFIFKG